MGQLQRILFIDDDELLSEFAIMVMESQGFEVLYCNCGEMALKQAEEFLPQLVLLDVVMPNMDGVTTYKKLRGINTLNSTPIIFLTGISEQDKLDNYLELGAIGIIAKPFDGKDICSKINVLWNEYNGK